MPTDALTPAVLDALALLDQQATPGPWTAENGVVTTPIVCPDPQAKGAPYYLVSNNAYDGGIHWSEMLPHDAPLIALLRTHAPALIATARENVMLREALASRDRLLTSIVPDVRGIDPTDACGSCGGAGKRTYGGTQTWRGGIGGQMLTMDVCDKCWGSGSASRPWRSWREWTPN